MSLHHEPTDHSEADLSSQRFNNAVPLSRRALRLVSEHPDSEAEAQLDVLLPHELVEAASNNLRLHEKWQETPRYGEYEDPENEIKMVDMLKDIHEALARHLKDDGSDQALSQRLEQDVITSEAFIKKAFANYRGESSPELPSDTVFAVPTRLSRDDDERYSHEVTPFLPIAEFVDSDILQRFVSSLPPCIIESYEPRNGEQGHVLFTPVFTDMMKDLPGLEALKTAQKVVNDAARFAHDKLGARVMGLGATIPGFTRYGNTIDVPDLLTTTGHGGTIALVEKTVEKVMENPNITPSDNIGVIGAGGSIGRSIVASMAERFPDKNILISDINSDRLEKVRSFCGELGIDKERIVFAENNAEVVDGSTVIVSAATGTVDLDVEMAGMDLNGKVLIDDSQPVCFDRDQAEKRGASVLWVVGDGGSIGLKREHGYNYGGDGSGIVGDTAAWGCELEAQIVSAHPELAVQSAVTPQIAAEIRAAFDEAGVTVAPLQSFGRLVQLPDTRA